MCHVQAVRVFDAGRLHVTGPSDREQASTPRHLMTSAALFFKRPRAAHCASPSTQLCVKPPYDQCDLKSAAEERNTGIVGLNITLERFDSRLAPARSLS